MAVIKKDRFLADLPVHDVLNKLRDKNEIVAGKNGWITVKCCNPQHPDKHPSCAVNVESKVYKCPVCGDSGDLITFVQKVLEANNRADAVTWLRKTFELQYYAEIHLAQVAIDHEMLKRTPIKMKYLRDIKGISEETIAKYLIGLRQDKYTIPIKEDDDFVNIRFYQPGVKDAKFKFTNTKGAKGKTLYPINQLQFTNIILTEGELKALLLIQHGFNAISTTCGAATWDDSWSELFEGKEVTILYDVDQAGKHNAKKIGYKLVAANAVVRIVELPLAKKDYGGKGDVTNYFVDEHRSAKELKALIENTELFVPLSGRRLHLDDKTITSVSLRAMSDAKYAMKRVSVKGIPQAIDRDCYQIPIKLKIECSRDYSSCGLCAVTKKGQELEIDREDLAIIELVNKPKSTTARVLKESLGIPILCNKQEFNVIKHINVQDVRVIPEESLSDPSQDVQKRLFCLSNNVNTNETYELNVRSWPHPDSQAAVGIAYEMRKAENSLDKFMLSEQDKLDLKIFQGGEAKLRELAEFQATSITKIYERQDLHLLMDVVWHSVLEIPFDGKVIKGWVEAVVVGDSGQGKTEVSVNLMHHYKCGTRIDTKSASIPGLVGTVEQVNGRWVLRWGKIPMNDRRLVILEEVKGMPPEALAKMTDMRSSGIAEVTKAGSDRHYARTRQIWISNPRNDRHIRSFPWGVEALKYLIGAPEDIRRFDIGICLATGEVDFEVLNAPKEQKTENRFTSELSNKLIYWCWSRKPEQIRITNEAKDAIYEVSKGFSEKYCSTIPLVEPADQRYKILRIATAIAGRLFSTEDGETLLVTALHVELAADFMQRCYDSKVMGYDKYSESSKITNELKNEQELKRLILNLVNPKAFVDGLKTLSLIKRRDVADLTNLDNDDVNELLHSLITQNALKSFRAGYIRSEAFTEFLNTLTEDELVTAIPEHIKEEEERF